MTLLAGLEPQRVLDDLRALADLTADEHGAQRLCWTPTWRRARAWLEQRLGELPRAATIERDEAGNLWAALAGRSSAAIVLGSHLDSVPDGGRLDGALGVIAALEILRAAAVAEPAALTLRLVDWADEEGARFGHSLFGSAAVAGLLDVRAAADLRDATGQLLPDVLAENGVVLERAPAASRMLDAVTASLELHIEQGPVLEDAGLALGVPTGTLAVERRRLHLSGAAAHAGATPMSLRRDPLAAAARAVLAAREAALAAGPHARATVGAIEARPGIVTAVAADVALTLDLRAPTDAELAALVEAVVGAVAALAQEERVAPSWESLWATPAVRFDERLVAAAQRAAGPSALRLPSGALHDSANLVRAGIPAGMLFVRSRGGVSHSPLEDSSDEDVIAGVTALAAVVEELLHP